MMANLTPLPRALSVGLLAFYLLISSMLSTYAQGDSPNRESFAARAERVFLTEQKRWEAEPTNAVAGWQYARACYDWAEYATSKAIRADIANLGITASRQVTALSPTLAPGHYYLAFNLGQLARTKTLGALRLVSEMETELKLAAGLDPKFDYAGPDRALGVLYFEAPGWPTSIGSRAKAKTHLERAVELSPGYPDNHLSLLEAVIKWSDQKRTAQEVEYLTGLMVSAKTNFSGEMWSESWADWNARWKKLQSKVQK